MAMFFRNIIIIHPGGIGDLVHLTPMLKILRQNFPQARIDLFIAYTMWAAEVLKQGGVVDRIFAFSFAKEGLWPKIKFLWQLRQERYDLCLIPSDVNPWRGSVLSLLIGAKTRVGERERDKQWGLFYTHTSFLDRKKHAAESNLDLLRAMGIKVNPPFPLPFSDFDQAAEWADQFLAVNNLKGRLLIGFQPGSGKIAEFKRWPKEYFIELGNKILDSFLEAAILLFGSPRERELCTAIAKGLKREAFVIDHAIRPKIALINRCQVFVAPDSGLAHLAATTSTHLVAIFGPTDSQRWRPLGPRVHPIREVCRYPYNFDTRKGYDRERPHQCLQRITPERVFNEVKKILERNKV